MISVIRNFQQVVENKDISQMGRELYQFLTLHCGFIAHYDINGFKAAYQRPRDFAEVFIRHFDRGHPYYNGVYSCHESPYKDTGKTKAEIKKEFERIADLHKESIARWAREEERKERYALYHKLRKEFEGGREDEGRV